MAIQPQIIIDNVSGYHNENFELSQQRLTNSKGYEDLSTVCIIPTRGQIPAKAVQSWMNLVSPMNQKFIRMFMIGMEVGDAYNSAINYIINNPELSQWKYLLTIEEDNIVPADGLLKMYEGMKDFDVVGGLYWTKGEGGQPMIYGNPNEMPMSFHPQVPKAEWIQEANGLGMGFNLYKMDIFKDEKVPRPWFVTKQEFIPSKGFVAHTQDIYFYKNIRQLGYRVACDTRVKVGHYDSESDIIW